MKKALALLLIPALLLPLLSACGKEDAGAASTPAESAAAPTVDFAKTDEEMFTERDGKTNYDTSDCIRIDLCGDTAAASADSVLISGSTVTITEDKTHVISGTLDDGMLIVNAPDTAKLQLVFDGAHVHSETSAALYILEADKVFLTMADGTENALSNGGTFTAIDENNVDGALFSKQDLTVNGAGVLTVTSPAGHGIVCKDDLVLTGGNITVNAASHGLDANDSVRIQNASLTVTAGKDAIHAENSDDSALGFVYLASGTISLTSEGDGISAGAYLQAAGGTVSILAGGGYVNGEKESSDNWGGMGGMMGRPGMRTASTSATDESSTSMKGIKAASGLLLSGGTLTIDSADDAVHSDASVTISDGTFELSSGDDAIHAEEKLAITAGTINITESYEGLEALHITVSGGDIALAATDDGLNAAGGTDASGTTGGRDGMFGGGRGPVGAPGGMPSSSGGSITISGGNLYINASGDGIDANGTLLISGGYTVVVGPTQGDTATLDYDVSATITGGTFIGTGASGMAQTFSDSTQGVIAVSVGGQAAGTSITLTDESGNTVISYAPALSFGVVILSSPDITVGESYTITVGELSGTFEAN